MKKKKDALLAQIMKMKPKANEEDFAVFALVMDDPNYPTWDSRLAFVGSFDQAARQLVNMTHVLAQTGFPKSGIRIEFYHSDGARRYLAAAAKEEKRYREERQSTQKN